MKYELFMRGLHNTYFAVKKLQVLEFSQDDTSSFRIEEWSVIHYTSHPNIC